MNRGFIKQILLIVIAIFLLAYFELFDIREWLDNPGTKDFFSNTWISIRDFISAWVVNPILNFWNNITN